MIRLIIFLLVSNFSMMGYANPPTLGNISGASITLSVPAEEKRETLKKNSNERVMLSNSSVPSTTQPNIITSEPITASNNSIDDQAKPLATAFNNIQPNSTSLDNTALNNAPLNSTARTIIAGTILKARTEEPLDSRARNVGYRFRMIIDADVNSPSNDRTIIKAGSKAQGIITYIIRSGKDLDPGAIIVELTSINIANRQVSVESFPSAGKAKRHEITLVGEIDPYEYIVIDQKGSKIAAEIPLMNKGYDFILNEGTVIYFTLKQPIIL